MSHPHKDLLDEFQRAIHQFVPTIPDELRQEAQAVHDEMLENVAVDELAIRRVFHDIGVREYPLRQAYNELLHTKEEGRLNTLVLEHVESDVRKVLEPHLSAGVHIDELLESDLLEQQLTPEQLYQVEDGLAVAKLKLGEAIKTHISTDMEVYARLVKKWEGHAKEIEKKLETLLAFAKKGDEIQATEIKNKVADIRAGFLVTEPDPDLYHIEEEIDYWKQTFAEDEE